MLARLVLGLVLASAILLATAAAVLEEPRSGARVEVQTGAVTLELAGPDSFVSLSPDTGCWGGSCPVISIRARLFSAPAQGAQGETRRVEYISAGALQR